MAVSVDDAFLLWLEALERRHLADLTFSEVRRGLQALSTRYVEARGRIRKGAALDGAGKRAAFALFYAPLHHLVTRHVLSATGADATVPREISELGCGTGAASAAWAVAVGPSKLTGIDIHPWAVQETRHTWQSFGLRGSVRQGDLCRIRLPGSGGAILLAYTVNELDDGSRGILLKGLTGAAAAGARVLVIEPISRRITPWWDEWARAFSEIGGRSDEWRFEVTLPELLRRLDRAAGLDHRELTARSLWLGPGRPAGDDAGAFHQRKP